MSVDALLRSLQAFDEFTRAAEVHTGAMVALIPSDEDAKRLAVDGGEPVDQLHLTLRYLGKAADFSEQSKAHLIELVRSNFAGFGPVTGDLFSIALFNPGGDEPCVVGLVGGDDVWRGYLACAAAVEDSGADLPDPRQPYVAHVTLEYTGDASQVDALTDKEGPVTFDRIRIAFGGVVTDIPLTGASATREWDAQPRDPGGDGGGQWVKGGGLLKGAAKAAGEFDDAFTDRPQFGALVDRKTIGPEDVRAIRAVFDGKFGDYRSSVREATLDWGGVYVAGDVLDDSGTRVGWYEYILSRDDDGKLVAHLEKNELDRAVQGSGFFTAYNAHLMDWYRASGVDRVELEATLSVGGYAWARAGFDWISPGWAQSATAVMDDELRRRGGETQFVGSPDPAEQMQLGREMIGRLESTPWSDPDFPTPYEVSQLGRWPGAGRDDMWIGKWLLLGNRWVGVLRL